MTLITPIPKRTRDIVEKHAGTAHPGLWLDKYARSFDPQATELGKLQERVQEPTLEHVVKLSQSVSMAAQFSKLRDRRLATLRSCGIEPTSATTLGPLTLHLSRASALENAGICLHPIYGFAYLPGSGLKGMAHAYACEVWLPTQVDRDLAWRHICDVFGTASSPWLKQLAERLGVRYPKDARAGAVVFHDAWPTQWPKLIVDIVNCHHPDYYGASENDNDHPPGDWENPVPVNFLAIAPGVQFEFAVSLRRASRLTTVVQASSLPTDDRLEACPTALDRAAQWLAGALMHLGAGAKTNAGYGAFRIDEPALAAAVQGTWDAATQSKARAEFSCTLELVTPAFLAGANHDDPAGCDLRPATLRGALRWWWRTLHAGHVDTATLRRLEAVIWGDTKLGGAVRIKLTRSDGAKALRSNTVERFNKRNHETVGRNEKIGDYGIPNLSTPDPNKITPGVAYLAFGMDDMVRDDGGGRRQRQRLCLVPGSRWKVSFIARSVDGIAAELILEQARAALWLLATYGGVGSKSRKGFGSIVVTAVSELTLPICEASASQARRVFDSSCKSDLPMESSALDRRAGELLQEFGNWTNVWAVLEQVGFAVQAFAKMHSHDVAKRALGLPRKIDRPKAGRFEPSGSFKPVYEIVDKSGHPPKPWEKARFASPWHIHFDKSGSGYRVRVTAFVQSTLPNAEESRRLLTEFIEFLRSDLARRAGLNPRSSGPRQARPGETPQPVAPSAPPMRIVTRDEVAQKVVGLASPKLLFRIERAGNAGEYHGQFLRHAANVAAKYQADGGKRLTNAPDNLGDGVLVIGERVDDTNRATFLEIFGRLAPPPDKPRGNPRRR